MYEFSFTTEIAAPLDRVWAVWSDMPKYPEWDPRELELRLDGPFAAGTTGYSRQKGNPGGTFRVLSVDAPTGWINVSPLPGGELVIAHRLDDLGGRTRATKTYRASGPLQLLFRLWFAAALRRAMPATWSALAARIDGAA
jgi:uncharacterized protein YndB with AHSA1/START domain